MPDIGTTLREARMRARIDISEIEAETKIRAKYLRALENEEWDLLPGPDVRQELPAHLRRRARARRASSSSRSTSCATSASATSSCSRSRRPASASAGAAARAAIPRGWLVALVVVGAARRARGVVGNRNSGDSGAQGSTPPPATTPTTTTSASKASSSTKTPRRRPRPSRRSRACRSSPPGQVYVCLKAAGKRTLVPGIVADRRRAPGPVQVLALPPAAGDRPRRG